MSKRIATWCAIAAMGLFGTLMLAIPAQAQSGSVINGTTPDLGENPPSVTINQDGGCGITLTFDNYGPYTDGNGHNGPWFAEFDYRVEGDTPLDLEAELDGLAISDPPLGGQLFDGLYNPVPVEAGQTVNLDVELEPGTTQVEYRLVRGAEQRVFFDWVSVEIVTCPEKPTPTPSATVDPEPTATPTADLEPTTEPTDDPADKPGLPVTGSKLGWLVGGGAGLLATGAGALGLSKLRRFRLQ